MHTRDLHGAVRVRLLELFFFVFFFRLLLFNTLYVLALDVVQVLGGS